MLDLRQAPFSHEYPFLLIEQIECGCDFQLIKFIAQDGARWVVAVDPCGRKVGHSR